MVVAAHNDLTKAGASSPQLQLASIPPTTTAMITHGVLDKHGYDVILDISGSGYHSSDSSCMSSSTTSTTLSSASVTSSLKSSASWTHLFQCCCYRTKNRYATSSTGFRLLAWMLAAMLFVSFYWFGSGYMKSILVWIETQSPWVTFCVFQVSFAIVSFPVVVGYLILIITSGYLFGCVKGLATVVIGANLGAAIAHYTIHSWHTHLPIQR